MSHVEVLSDKTGLSENQRSLLVSAGEKITPAWPLDQMIAVNPFWTMRSEPIEQVAVQVSALGNASLLMPKAYYHSLYRVGDITPEALMQAAREQQVGLSQEALEGFLQEELQEESGQEKTTETHWHNISDLLDDQRDQHKMAWRDEIIHQISQFCAAHYQQWQSFLGNNRANTSKDLYQQWLYIIQHDPGISIIMDEPGLNDYFKQLPNNADALFAEAIEALQLNDDVLESYAHALLLDINGWASWVAYLRWQDELNNQPHDDMPLLLAIRLAWDLVIWRYWQEKQPEAFAPLESGWGREKNRLPVLFAEHQDGQRLLWVWAKAAELSYQQQLNRQLQTAKPHKIDNPELQALFCIDVRSELMRRALESQSDQIETFGFAGFFGLPLEYQPQHSSFVRPQLPGLLKATLRVTEKDACKRQEAALNLQAGWQSWSRAAPSMFSMVESMGWLNAFKMLKHSFFPSGKENPVNSQTHQTQWYIQKGEKELDVKDKAELAQGILNAMGLREFAPVVLLVGHGSHTTNNLHAAGLDCGACGGQTGEINVRVLAELLNDKDVRKILAARNILIPTSTQFVAALHNTTTDHIECFGQLPDARVKQWLASSTQVAQRERMLRIDPALAGTSHQKLDDAYKKRSRDWSQVRPEWGLANNASFIIAPRAWTRGINLQGRSFLHNYRWQDDKEFAVLELIMTAPMIVTNWINMQYNASVTDNFKYGSGNKVLHNAVGGNIGVFEGNGGDLRMGLSKQSIHNGEKWMHQPQRLAVYIAAPCEPVEQIVEKHSNVRHLIDNEWLYLLRWSDDGVIERLYRDRWVESLRA